MYEDRIKWIEHKGKKILYVNRGEMTIEQMLEMSKELLDIVLKEEKHSVLYCVDVS